MLPAFSFPARGRPVSDECAERKDNRGCSCHCAVRMRQGALMLCIPDHPVSLVDTLWL